MGCSYSNTDKNVVKLIQHASCRLQDQQQPQSDVGAPRSVVSTAYMLVCCTNHAWMNSIGRARKQLQIPDQIRLKIVMWFLFSMDRSE
jgi:hypothetical protein